GSLVLQGNGSGTAMTVGPAILDAGYSTVVSRPGSNDALLTFPSLDRTNRGTLLVRATDSNEALYLGQSPTGTPVTPTTSGTNAGGLFITSAPAVVGGGGAAGSTNLSIVPWAVSDTPSLGVASTFVTYSSAQGFRGLRASEYASIVTPGSVT